MDAKSLLDMAWNIIAAAGEKEWAKESVEWQESVALWRDAYYLYLAQEEEGEYDGI